MTDNRAEHTSSREDQSFSTNWSTYERDGTGNTELRKVGIIPYTVNRNPLTSKGNKPSNNNSVNNYNSSSSNNNRAWISRHVSPTHTPPFHSSSSMPNNLDPKRYNSCMINKAPRVRIPDEEATELNQDQRLVVESVLSGYNTFFTGPAGSGKSHILDYILRMNELQLEGTKKKNIVITATTGLAACNVGGVTIHSFAGVGTGEEPLQNMISRVIGNEYTKQRWRECDVLIIDEISMMPAEFLDKLATIASRARNDQRHFGGIQIVVCGDFFQLPPVNIEKNKFAFEADIWTKIITTSVCLTAVFRQNKDLTFVKILNEARVGELSPESIDLLRRHSQRSLLPKTAMMVTRSNENDDDGCGVVEETTRSTLLESKNAVVDRLNKTELDRLPGDTYRYEAKDHWSDNRYEGQLKSCQAPKVLELKVGATVMLLKNLDAGQGLVNGIRGVVVDFQKESDEEGFPKQNSKKEEVPLVCFKQNQDDEPKIKEIKRAEWSNKIGDVVVSSRKQIPLRLGYALTIHKSQGMTIPDLVVNLSDTFEYGQAYVAISRATCLDKLILKGFNERQFRAHPKVKEFYRLLGSTQLLNNHVSSKMEKAVTSDDTDKELMEKKRHADDSLTDDQLRRIAENRNRALLLRQERENKLQT